MDTSADTPRTEWITEMVTVSPSITESLVERIQLTESLVERIQLRIQWAIRQVNDALVDSRVDGAAAAWLRTIKRTLADAAALSGPVQSETEAR